MRIVERSKRLSLRIEIRFTATEVVLRSQHEVSNGDAYNMDANFVPGEKLLILKDKSLFYIGSFGQRKWETMGNTVREGSNRIDNK